MIRVTAKGMPVNLSFIAGVVMLLAWIALVYLLAVPTGYVHILYAGGIVLLARRLLVGAPRFLS